MRISKSSGRAARTALIAGAGAALLLGSGSPASALVPDPDPYTTVEFERFDARDDDQPIETITVTSDATGTVNAVLETTLVSGGEAPRVATAEIDIELWVQITRIAPARSASELECRDYVVATYTTESGAEHQSAACTDVVPCGPVDEVTLAYQSVRDRIYEFDGAGLAGAGLARGELRSPGRAECTIVEMPTTTTTAPPQTPPPGAEAWPADAFVIEYWYSGSLGDPSGSFEMSFVAGRVGDGTPSVDASIRYPDGEVEQMTSPITVDAWSASLEALFAAGLSTSTDDCAEAVQYLTVTFGGDDIVRVCSADELPPEEWTAVLDPLGEELHAPAGPDLA